MTLLRLVALALRALLSLALWVAVHVVAACALCVLALLTAGGESQRRDRR